MIRVIIAHQDGSIRLALRMFLQAQQDVEVVSEVKRAGELLSVASVESPDLIMMSWNLPDIEKYSLSGHLDRSNPTPTSNQVKGVLINSLHHMPTSPLVVVTGSLQEDVFAVLYAGADEYLYHGEEPARLLAIIENLRGKE